jgi:hypothetical protein
MGRDPGACGRAVRWKIGCPGTGRPGVDRGAAPSAAGAPGAGSGALYTGRGPVCGMIIRGGGADGVTDLAVTAPCVCATPEGGCAAGGALPAAAGVVVAIRGGTTIAGGGAVLAADEAAAGGVAETLGGITTTDGGRYVAATEAGVTSLAGGGVAAGASITGLGGVALAGDTGTAGASFASIAVGATGVLTAGRAAGCSTAPFCWMARSTSPGREIFDRSILVLISSSPRAVREVFAELGAASERRRRCFRTNSASWSSRELECVFFSVTPTVVSTSRISLLLTSNSRARSLIRILLIRSRFLVPLISPV